MTVRSTSAHVHGASCAEFGCPELSDAPAKSGSKRSRLLGVPVAAFLLGSLTTGLVMAAQDEPSVAAGEAASPPRPRVMAQSDAPPLPAPNLIGLTVPQVKAASDRVGFNVDIGTAAQDPNASIDDTDVVVTQDVQPGAPIPPGAGRIVVQVAAPN